ncbi:hypothetical protein PPERSA_03958 [Pseudocohnilembus persalinus]|uniref:Uncharacterized protein n=1 Tax=Pseudocohnilembus persalinus TaxID=266149 RepID=A0A0V0QB17_PSEPJ|nr:hypothetical protein PPERSA_03958 [Pseudocohnilembus persalinus]|eukprot:KRW99252.1 hypothetical protein PPERSA_03958 [Pseudocohnilembus persalinus]
MIKNLSQQQCNNDRYQFKNNEWCENFNDLNQKQNIEVKEQSDMNKLELQKFSSFFDKSYIQQTIQKALKFKSQQKELPILNEFMESDHDSQKISFDKLYQERKYQDTDSAKTKKVINKNEQNQKLQNLEQLNKGKKSKSVDNLKKQKQIQNKENNQNKSSKCQKLYNSHQYRPNISQKLKKQGQILKNNYKDEESLINLQQQLNHKIYEVMQNQNELSQKSLLIKQQINKQQKKLSNNSILVKSYKY